MAPTVTRRSFTHLAMAVSTTVITGRPAMARDAHYKIPAEDAAHDACFMQWPNDRSVYPDKYFLDDTQATIANIANTIAEFEPVIMLAGREFHADIRRQLTKSIEIWDIPTNDLWARDAGPVFASNGRELIIQDFGFNGWGNKQNHNHDGLIAKRVAEYLGMRFNDTGLVGEAGGVEHDAEGRLIAHESSWVIDNRNPNLSRDAISERLLKAYGAKELHWTPGLPGEDITDYHIDSLARFTPSGKVLINLPDDPDPDDPFHETALETYDMLVDAGFDIDVIPEPNKRRVDSEDFLASYANYYVANGGVICARYGDRETDKIARNALAHHYPEREIVMLDVDALGELGGGIHCATQQMPRI